MNRHFLLIVTLGVASPTYGADASKPTQATPQQAVNTLTALLVPKAAILQIADGGLSVTWREHISAWPEMIDLERRFPGITDAMVSGARNAADAYLDKELMARASHTRTDLEKSYKPEVLTSISYAFQPLSDIFNRTSIVFKPGDTTTTALHRSYSDAGIASATASVQTRIGRLPTPELREAASSFSALMQKSQADGAKLANGAMQAALPAGRTAANDFVRAKGSKDIPFSDVGGGS